MAVSKASPSRNASPSSWWRQRDRRRNRGAARPRRVRLVLADIDAAGLDRTVARSAAMIGRWASATDVSSFADCERAVASAVDRFGRVDILVNCAGIWIEGPTDSMTEADWDRVMDVNLKGTFAMCPLCDPGAGGDGRVHRQCLIGRRAWGGKGAASTARARAA